MPQQPETPNPCGRVLFVGAGPGAVDLLTIRAAECLRVADVVVHDALVPRQLLDAIGGGAERIPICRDGGDGSDPGASTGRLLVRLAQGGRTVVRLKGGDPSVFARLAEEMRPLREAGVPVDIVPGVTTVVAAAAAAGVPLTSRAAASSLTIVTGHEAGDKDGEATDFQLLASMPGTIAIYMGVDRVEHWSAALMAAGMSGSTPVTVVSRCSWAEQRIGTTNLAGCASDFQRHGWLAPAIVIVGEAAEAMPVAGPLAGRRVLLTRPAGQGGELAALVRAAGGECLEVPVLRIEEPATWEPLDEAIRQAATYDWIVFSSAHGVRAFARRLRSAGRDGRALGTARLAAIGPATRRELDSVGLVCDLMPDTFRSEGLVEAFAGVRPGGRFLLMRPERGRDLLSRDLAARGHHVHEVVAYAARSVKELEPALLEAIDRAAIDWIVVTSPAIAEACHGLFGTRMAGWKRASISPLTSAALRDCGLEPTVEASEATMESLVEAIGRRESGG